MMTIGKLAGRRALFTTSRGIALKLARHRRNIVICTKNTNQGQGHARLAESVCSSTAEKQLEEKAGANALPLEDFREEPELEPVLDELLERYGDWLDRAFQRDEEGDGGGLEELIGAERVRDPLNEPDLSEMVTGEESASRPINRFREIVYSEGELEHSDLSQPPSRHNPHPFRPNPSQPRRTAAANFANADGEEGTEEDDHSSHTFYCDRLPPTHSRSLAPYANHLPVLQLLVELNVDLYTVMFENPKIGRALVKMNLEKEVKPKIFWLVKKIGIPEDEIGPYLTRNPYFLLQDFDKLKSRLNYLRMRRFSADQIASIVVRCRYWLNFSHEDIDGRLGWIQRQFQLRAEEVRRTVVKEPRVIQFGLGPLQAIAIFLNQQCGFTHPQLRWILFNDPRIFMCDLVLLKRTYNYLAFTMKVDNQQIVDFPCAMRFSVSSVRRRHEYLFRLGKANYVPDTPEHIRLDQLLHPSDRYFAEEVAKTPLDAYNQFLSSQGQR